MLLLVGGLAFLYSTPKTAELGRITFFVALVWLAYVMTHTGARP
jgi:hypothetical protein